MKLKIVKLFESLLSNISPEESTLRDTQIGDTYIFLIKKGNKFIVKTTSASSPVDPKFNKSMKILLSTTNEDIAYNKFHELTNKVIKDL